VKVRRACEETTATLTDFRFAALTCINRKTSCIAIFKGQPEGLRQESARIRELLRQVFADHIVEAPFGERLLLSADARCEQLLDGGDPLGMGHDERIVVYRILRALDVRRGQRVGRVLEPEIDNILRRAPRNRACGTHRKRLT